MTTVTIQPDPSPLRIAVVGAGRIGSTFASRLASQGGHEVTVVARPGSTRLRQLERDGAITDVGGGRTEVRVASSLDENTPYDLVVVTVLAHQLEPLMPVLRASAARCILFMFNTFDPERLREAIGPGRCTFGMPFVQATLTAEGRLEATIGAGGQRTLVGEQRWVDAFDAAGLPAALERDMPLWLRCHVPLCVAFESVSVAALRRGGGATWGEALVLARGVHASYRLVEGLGHGVHPRSKRLIAASPAPVLAAALWGMSRVRRFRELLATGEAECVALVDDMVAAAPATTPAATLSAIRSMKPRPRAD